MTIFLLLFDHDPLSNISSDASELLENLEEMFPRYYIHSGIINTITHYGCSYSKLSTHMKNTWKLYLYSFTSSSEKCSLIHEINCVNIFQLILTVVRQIFFNKYVYKYDKNKFVDVIYHLPIYHSYLI